MFQCMTRNTATLLLKHFPIDQTLLVESIQVALILGKVAEGLQQSALYSTWLAAHLSDLLAKINVVMISLRDHFVLEYTDLLQSDSTLWRLTIDYLATCGDEGRARMKRIIMSIPFEAAKDVTSTGEERESESKYSVVEDVLSVCAQYGMEAEEVSICKVGEELPSRFALLISNPFRLLPST
jgi:nuclear pore complex protein Nup85